MDSQNVFPKNKVINAAKITLQNIYSERARMKEIKCRGHKRFFGFGAEIPVEDYWDSLSNLEQLQILAWAGRQEAIVTGILCAAEVCIGDTINLTTTDLACIIDEWQD